MCGIAGFISSRETTAVREDAVGRMCAHMVHRGPDDSGLVSSSEATLGMRRLAIFDPAHGHQPMSTPDDRWHVVFNGAIYNHRQLRAELISTHDFRTDCDTEVLLASLARWGRDALPRLRGMFAFAAWDTREHTLLLARDSFGIKPLYIHTTPDGELLFASELNALLASSHAPSAIDPQSVSDYLTWLSVPAPRTIYRDIQSLCAGECAVWRNGQLTITAYDRAFNLFKPDPAITVATSRDEFLSGLRTQLEDTVRAHVVADVPVGAFLSGGLDSTALVALMTKLSGAQLKTFSIGFDDPAYSESNEAAANARHLGTIHHTSILTGSRIAADIDRLIATLDQPTGDGFNTYYASQTARAGGVTVALSGLGADELFGGYPSFHNVPRLIRWLPLWRTLPRPLRNTLLSRWDRGDTRHRKLADTLRHADTPTALALLQRRVFAESTRYSLLAPEFAPCYTPHPAQAALTSDLRTADLFTTISATESRGYMNDVLLRDSDAMSMAHSLELRTPFVDRPLVRWLASQHASFKHTPAHPKSALSASLRELLPPELIDRKKRGFSPPFATWMRGPLKPFLSETFSNTSISRSGFLNTPAVQAFWQSYLVGRDTREWSRVWSLAILIAFMNRPRPGPIR